MRKTLLYTILIFIFLSASVYYYRIHLHTKVTIKFDNLRPFKEKPEVFYKGFKIGKVLKIKPSSDYKSTLVTIVLYPQDLKLPSNVTAKLMMEKNQHTKTDYIEIFYPETPVATYLKRGSVILGKSTVDIDSYLASQNPETLDEIRDGVGEAVKSIQYMFKELGNLFVLLQDVIQENRANIKSTTGSFAKSSNNIERITIRLNRSFSDEKLDNTTENADYAVAEMKETTKTLNIMAKNINNSVPQILHNTNCITKNLNEITCGISNSLKKRMGGLRILFGKPINNDCACD